jgi:hypothetical protein
VTVQRTPLVNFILEAADKARAEEFMTESNCSDLSDFRKVYAKTNGLTRKFLRSMGLSK